MTRNQEIAYVSEMKDFHWLRWLGSRRIPSWACARVALHATRRRRVASSGECGTDADVCVCQGAQNAFLFYSCTRILGHKLLENSVGLWLQFLPLWGSRNKYTTTKRWEIATLH